jgi:hypothetical protein
MKRHKILLATGLAAGLYLTTLSPINPAMKESSMKMNANIQKTEYVFMLDAGGINPTSNAKVNVIHNKDTAQMYTNQLGTVYFKAYPQDKIEFYPTEKSDKFQNLELILTDKNLNIVVVDPKTNKVDTTSRLMNYGQNTIAAKVDKNNNSTYFTR